MMKKAILSFALALACGCGSQSSSPAASELDSDVSTDADGGPAPSDSSATETADSAPADTDATSPSASCVRPPKVDCEATSPARCWYVALEGADDAAGTKVAPLRHIWKGLGAARPGDFVYVRAGVWKASTESAAIHCGDGNTNTAIVPIVTPSLYGAGGSGEPCLDRWPAYEVASGTPTAPITLAAFPGEHVVLDGERAGKPGEAPAYVIHIGEYARRGDVAYWTIRGFDIIGAVFVSGNGIAPDGSLDKKANPHHITLEGNEIRDVMSWGGNNPGMIKIDRGDYGGPYEITVRCNHIHDLRDNDESDWTKTTDAQHYGAVTTLSAQAYLGVDKGGTGRIVIERNVIHALPHAFFFKNASEGPIEIRDNRIFDAQALGIDASSNLTFENNLVYGVPGGFAFGDEPTTADLVPLAGQNAKLIGNTLVSGNFGSCRSGVGHTIRKNVVTGISGRASEAGYDSPSLLNKSEVYPDRAAVADSYLQTIKMDDNCYQSVDADFQLVARYTATVEHYDLAAARTTFTFDLASKSVVAADASAIFVDAAKRDYRQNASSPCTGYGADLSRIPPAP